MREKIAIIGSGFSSLSASCYLSKAGFDVTILEKNNSFGGRARQFKKDGFTFDIGPSWYWMPDIFENFFNDFNEDFDPNNELNLYTKDQPLFQTIKKFILTFLSKKEIFFRI